MNPEQINLYGDPDQFKAAGKNPEELEKEAKEEILKNKIRNFVDQNSQVLTGIMKKEGKLGAFEINKFERQFSEIEDEKDDLLIRKFFAKALKEKGYKLSGAVNRAEIENEDGGWSEFARKKGKRDRLSNRQNTNELRR
ncbi:MAG TPA: hypothetical protein DIT25_01315 [Candidatus Moranbacteria bacterium]|nr:hypothetical protein [Candidatus Moranbacteria bacterium]